MWLEVVLAERYCNKKRFMIGTHAYSAYEVMIHSYWDVLQGDISELSHQIYSFSTSFFASFSLSILHMMMKGALFNLPHLNMSCSEASKASFLRLCFSGFLPPIQNWSFAEQIGTSLETLSAVPKWNVRFWMQSHLVCSLKSLPKRLRSLFQTVTIIPDLFPGVTLGISFSNMVRDL